MPLSKIYSPIEQSKSVGKSSGVSELNDNLKYNAQKLKPLPLLDKHDMYFSTRKTT